MFVRVTVKSGSRRELVTKVSDTVFSLHVREDAKQNMANKRVIQLMAEEFGVSTTQVRILTGHHLPSKMIRIG